MLAILQELWERYSFKGVVIVLVGIFVAHRLSQLLLSNARLKRVGLRGAYVRDLLAGIVVAGVLIYFFIVKAEPPPPVDPNPPQIAPVPSQTSPRGPKLPQGVKFEGPLAAAKQAIVAENWTLLAQTIHDLRGKPGVSVTDANLILHTYAPKLAKEFLTLAQRAATNNDKPAARSLVDYATDLDAEEPEGFLLRAAITEPADWRNAIRDLEHAAQRAKPGDTRALERRIALWLEHKELRAALADADILVIAKPNDARVLIERARLRAQVSQVDAAIADLTSARAALPGDKDVRIELARTRLLKDDDAQAKQALAEMDELLKEGVDARALQVRASARLDLRKYPDAIADVSRSIQLDATNADAFWLRARIRIEQDQIISALADLNTAIKLNANHRRAILWRGILTKERDPKKALDDFLKAAELERDGWSLYYIGDCLLRMGKRDEAEASFSDALPLAHDPKLVQFVNDGLNRARRKK